MEDTISNNHPAHISNVEVMQMSLPISTVLPTEELLCQFANVKDMNGDDMVYDNVCSEVEVPVASTEPAIQNGVLTAVNGIKAQNCENVSEMLSTVDDAIDHIKRVDGLDSTEVDISPVVPRFTSSVEMVNGISTTEQLTETVDSIEAEITVEHDSEQLLESIKQEEYSDRDTVNMTDVEIAGYSCKPTRKHVDSPACFQCEICDKVLSNSSNLKVHMRIHSGAHPFKCSICDKTFSVRPNMLRHERTHLGLKPWQCSECDKCFTEKKSLTVHSRTHTGERPFKCPYCSKGFAQASTLQTHIHVHTGWKGHLCDLCGKPFRQKTQLHLHRLRHADVRMFKCSVCSRGFITKGELTRHGLLHTGERPFLCSHCPKRFTRIGYLKDHVNLHTGEHPYQCGQCEAAFQDRSSYSKHLKHHAAEAETVKQEEGASLIMYLDPSVFTMDEGSREPHSLIESLLQQGQLSVDGMLPQIMNVQARMHTTELEFVSADSGSGGVDTEMEQATDSIAEVRCDKKANTDMPKSIVRTILTSL